MIPDLSSELNRKSFCSLGGHVLRAHALIETLDDFAFGSETNGQLGQILAMCVWSIYVKCVFIDISVKINSNNKAILITSQD